MTSRPDKARWNVLKQHIADFRIAMGWGEVDNLNHEERERLHLAEAHLEKLTARELMDVLRSIQRAGLPLALPLPESAGREPSVSAEDHRRRHGPRIVGRVAR